MPPMYSALKHKGKALYKYARKGEEIKRQARKIEIKEFEVLKINLPDIYFRIRCSKGTYIRSIANDLGEKLGTLGYLKELRRTKIGEYSIKDSIQLEDVCSDKTITSDNDSVLNGFLLPPCLTAGRQE